MEATEKKERFAWQPVTPRGVAAFARASPGRLLAVQVVVALLAAGAVIWVLNRTWFPVITQAIQNLPAQGSITASTLEWTNDSPKLLADNRFLAISVDLKHAGMARSPAHFLVEFGAAEVRIFSLFGMYERRYPAGWSLEFNRPELMPAWGAWAPPILALVALAVLAGLLLIWTALAWIYFLPVWLVGFFANRELSLRESRRLAGAALMPGALFMTGAILLYGLGALDLVHVLAAAAAHLVIGWIYLVAGPLAAPLHPAVAGIKPNPFKPVPAPEAASAEKPPPPENGP
jgi:hypothetical protein